jgi:hypothetical protein
MSMFSGEKGKNTPPIHPAQNQQELAFPFGLRGIPPETAI